ncbi:MAG: helix-turn-helix domain-containing protein [Bdellovibrionaceae bacterium]|jgi:excisionase family DNA binding protein|nr:helix-turn-helix domain-containing protein [Pseudobdellovibrionaceae bacterium]
MVVDNCQTNKSEKSGGNQSVSHEMCNSDLLFEKLIWMTTEEAARYLRKSANAIRIMVHKKILRARKFRRRLYFKKDELDALIETSFVTGGY